VPEFIRVDAASIEAVQRYLREEADPRVTLGAPWLAPGSLGNVVCSVARASAVTLGSIVFLERSVAARLNTHLPAFQALGALFVHEAMHLWQWRRDGSAGFIAKYLYFYLYRLFMGRVFTRRGRDRAYRAIPAEVEAFEIESRWCQRHG